MSIIVLFEKYFKKKNFTTVLSQQDFSHGNFFLWEKPAGTELHYPTYGAHLVL